ncbi:MAG TPA: 3-hydroxyacyl-CoA dehydrogenase family protein [Microbacterium sp.]|uniref:3-hydroxyacyl-CoA dehydrogenase family protein n=1 Tax=Microbacterium sp. TaxID=51671 RepID=UPI002BE44671|nr:3-hydroxyacyl-CoA dehydrogenase family protein [Microbacterium sp.]HWI31698.1 3-hydroxyacyl-CoA dehydrogenase family protein [Microbacterium sp.]
MDDQTSAVAVIGAGLMGHAIALTFAAAGRTVSVYDPELASRASLPGRVERSLRDLGRTDAQVDQTLARITVCADLAEAVHDAAYVTEAAPERLDVKRGIFADLERVVPAGTILASNTSVIPITQITALMSTPERAVGTHWWNPGHLIPLVEVVPTEWTTDDTVERTVATLAGIGKSPVRVKRDVPGFIGNRLQHALWREAINIVEQGYCSAADIDLVVTSGFGRRLAVLGPMANADLIGTDLTLDIHTQVLYDLDGRPEPSPLLRELVGDGRLGWKSGEGFMSWTAEEQDAVRERVSAHLLRMSEQLDRVPEEET